MKRTTLALLSAGFLGLLGRTDADAASVTFSPTPFTASETTDFRTGTGFHNLPFTDSFGNVISPNGGSTGQVGSPIGLTLSQAPGPIPGVASVTFALSAPSNMIGFNFQTSVGSEYLSSATFSNGDVFTGGPTFRTSGNFMGFTDSSSFTSVTLNFTGDSGLIIDDFRVAPAAVPEPSTMVLGGEVVALVCVVAWHRRKRRKAVASV